MSDVATVADTRRLHPGTIALSIVGQAPKQIPGLIALTAAFSRGHVAVAAAILGAGVVLLGVFAWVRWRQFSYTIGAGELTIAEGLFHRSRRSIPFERIQDVSIEQKPLARLFGLARVKVETGGGDADEASLDSVTLVEAARLRGVLRQGGTAATTTGPAEPKRVTVFAMPIGRVLTMGAFGFSLVWVGVLFAALNQLGDLIDFDWREVRDIAGIAREQAIGLVTPIFAALAFVAALLLGAISGIVRTLLVEYGFRLEREGDRLRRVRGLLTRTEVVVSLRRVQLALIERAMVSGRFGWSSLRFQTLGGSDDAGGRQGVAPFARDGEVAALLAEAGYPRFDPLPLRPVAFGHVVRAGVLRGGVPLIAIAVASIFLPLVAFALLFLPIPVGVALLVRRRHRYAIVGDSLQVMRGVLAKQAWIVPLARIQAVSVTRGPLQRLLGLATVRVGTAGARGMARPDIVDLAVEDADALARALLRRVG
ncbi:PH domain-containing protein [Sphingomonas sp. Leaf4]|uniref:PH domain-containing protein n=1 Tax=Sphingomonas sp. Leaf4 TaxID=2876553 RepID=UPI001E2A4C2D|nr:PH domain-containing protein [Sphingomonas sp. Leaf4]